MGKIVLCVFVLQPVVAIPAFLHVVASCCLVSSLYCLLSHLPWESMGAKEEEFDEYAEEFEKHLVTVLDYKLPEAGATETHTP